MGNNKKEIYVIGHKNPDTDSICSAIAYAELKSKITGKVFLPKRAGDISNETKYVLETFDVPAPEYISYVGTQVSDIEIKNVGGISGDFSLRRAYRTMEENNAMTLAITTKDNNLEGLVTIGDLAKADMDVYDNKFLSKANTKYKNIVETLDGTIITGDEEAYFNKGKVIIAAANPDLMENYLDKGDMVILSNRFESQFLAIEMNAGCIVVCVGVTVPETIQRIAREKGCTIISTPHDTYTTARLINQSIPVKHIMTGGELTSFHIDDYTDELKDIMAKQRHRYFPVLDENDKYVGLVSKRSFLDMEKKKVILVDHNEKTQAVDGIEDADILEIIDHHRLGNLETISPVFFRNQPLGCTATIIYQMYCENNIAIEKKTAGLLCAAILSDTLVFRSPTCTETDKDAAEKLAEIAGINPEEFAKAMFSAGSDLKDKTAEEIFYQDFKTFATGDITFGVGQINAMNVAELQSVKQKLSDYMTDVLQRTQTNMLFFMLTDILEESTELLFQGMRAKETLRTAFGEEPGEDSVALKGVVSRKKQLIPAIISALQQ